MFFKNIATWSRSKLRAISIFFNCIYLGLTLVGPLSIVCWKYQVFTNKSGVQLTGVGIIAILVVVLLLLRNFKKVVNKLPDNRLQQQRLKYTLLWLYSMAFPFVGLVGMICLKSDFIVAYSTFKWCLGFIIAGITVDYFAIKYIDRELEIRHAAEFDAEKDARRANGVI